MSEVCDPPAEKEERPSSKDAGRFPLDPLAVNVPEEKRRLTGFLLLAILAHLALFWTVHLNYPTPLQQPAPRVRASLATLPAQSPVYDSEERDRRFWSQLQDPSLLILPQSPLEADLAALRARRPGETASLPAQDAVVTALRPIELKDPGRFLPTGLFPIERRVAIALSPPAQTFRRPDYPVPPLSDSAFEVSGPLSARPWVIPPKLPNPSTELLNKRGYTTFLVAADPRGRVAHIVVMESSGDRSIDRLGEEALRQSRLSPLRKTPAALRLPGAPDQEELRPQSRFNPTRPSPLPRPASLLQAPALEQAPSLTWGEIKVFWRFKDQTTAPKPGPQPNGS